MVKAHIFDVSMHTESDCDIKAIDIEEIKPDTMFEDFNGRLCSQTQEQIAAILMVNWLLLKASKSIAGAESRSNFYLENSYRYCCGSVRPLMLLLMLR